MVKKVLSVSNSIDVIVFGGQQIAVDCVRFLNQRKDVNLLAVVTEDGPLDALYGYTSLKRFIQKHKIRLLSPSEAETTLLKEAGVRRPDFIFSFYYRHKISPALLRCAKRQAINIHPSFLPFYRGPAPTAWAMERGEKKFGITLHLMDTGIDTGDWLVRRQYPIKPNETGFELFNRSMALGAELFIRYFDRIKNGKLKRNRQERVYGSYFGKKLPQAWVPWQRPVEEIYNLVRVYAKPYQRVRAKINGRTLYLNKVSVLGRGIYRAQGPGKILDRLNKGRLIVSGVDVCLVLEDYEFVPKTAKSRYTTLLKKGERFQIFE